MTAVTILIGIITSIGGTAFFTAISFRYAKKQGLLDVQSTANQAVQETLAAQAQRMDILEKDSRDERERHARELSERDDIISKLKEQVDHLQDMLTQAKDDLLRAAQLFVRSTPPNPPPAP